MVNKATLGLITMLLLVVLGFSTLSANAQTATPGQAIITVSGVPAGLTSLAVEVTVDTAIVKLGSPSADVASSIAVAGTNSEGVGVIATTGELPASLMITAPLTGVAAGTSMVAVGKVLDMIGGTEIAGATATVDISSTTVSAATSSSSTSSSSSSSTGGSIGGLDNDTFTVTIDGQALTATSAVNVTIAFGTPGVATLDTAGLTFMANGASQLLVEANSNTNVLSAAWSGTITDNQLVLTGMLKPGSSLGTTTISVSKVEVGGGQDITDSVVSTVNPISVTNSGAGGSSGFALIGPTSLVRGGTAAIAISATTKPMSATLNGEKVDFVSDTVGIAIVKLTMTDSLPLTLKADGETISLGEVALSPSSQGKPPKVNSVRVQNNPETSILRVLGSRFSKESTSLEIIPTDRASASVAVKGRIIKATYDPANCIPQGSYINVTTAGGTRGKRIKTRGTCSNPLRP